jgi:HAE1 family hydrophobic/amphiphilic exporter-1
MPRRSVSPASIASVLGWALRWRKTTLLLALAAFVGSFALVKFIGFEFVPQADLGEQVVSIETPAGSSLEYTEAKLKQVDIAVREFPEIDYTYGTVNTGYANGKNLASLYLRYKPLKQRKRSPADLAQPIRDRLASIPGILVSINIPGGPGRRRTEAAPAVAAGPRHGDARPDLPGRHAPRRRDLRPGRPRPQPEGRQADAVGTPAARCRFGPRLGTAVVAQSLRPLFAGDETSLWRAPDGENYTVMVRLPADERTGVADLQRIWLTAGTEANGLPRMVISRRSPTS